MIRLGDVSFGLGADTKNLRSSVRVLQQFGTQVEKVQTQTSTAANVVSSSFRKQEKAAVDALNTTLRLTQQMSKFKGTDAQVEQVAKAFSNLNTQLTKGQLSALQYQRAMEQWKSSTGGAVRSFRDITKAAQDAEGRFGTMRTGLDALKNSAILIQGPLGGIATRISNLSMVLGKGGAAALSLVAGFATVGFAAYQAGKQMHLAGIEVNRLLSQFEAITGNINMAQAELRKIIQISRASGQSIDVLGKSFARFKIAAEGTGLAAKTINDGFMIMAKASTRLQLTEEETAGVFKALEQMMSKGTIQAEELRGQLGDRLPGAVNIMARALGVTTAKLQDMMKAGEVSTVEALPKFFLEVARTLRISDEPITNYTASVNNMKTAWFQLWAALNDNFKVTDRVVDAFDKVTQSLDYLRESIPTVKEGIRGLNDYWVVLSEDLKNSDIAAVMAWGIEKGLEEIKKRMSSYNVSWEDTWAAAKQVVYLVTNDMFDFFYNFSDSVPLILKVIPDAVALYTTQAMEGMLNKIQTAMDTVSAWFKPWTDPSGTIADYRDSLKAGAHAGSSGASVGDPNLPNANTAVDSITDKVERIRKIFERNHDILGQSFKRWQEIQEDVAVRRLANSGGGPAAGRGKLTGAGLPGNKGKNEEDQISKVTELTEKQVKALQKKADAMQAINDELDRTYEEIEALGGTEATLNSLTEKFKREKEVEKYAKALRKAGVETQFITQKTQELLAALEKRDELTKYRKGLEEFRDSLANAFDTVGQSIVDGMFEGENALKSFGSVAKNIAKEIAKTYVQLAIINPILNSIFGLDRPTLKPNFLGSLGNILGGAGTQATQAQAVPMGPNAAAHNAFRIAANANNFPIGTAAGTTKTGIPLTQITTQGISAKVASEYANRFQGLFRDLEAAGYKIRSLGEGGYSYRNVAGTKNLSKHSFGEAIDINPRENPWSYSGRTDMPSNIREIAKRNGLTWGGDWNKPDTMHFQVNKNIKMASDSMEKVARSTAKMSMVAERSTQSIGKFGGGLENMGNALSKIPAGGGGGGGIFGFLNNIFSSIFGGGALNLFGGGNVMPDFSAKGNAFVRGQKVRYYSKGGMLGGRTAFPMSGGMAIGGENQQNEAIMPLRRDSMGNLGVSASLGGGGNVYVNIQSPAGTTAKTSKRQDSKGDTFLDIVIQEAKASIAQDVVKGGTEMNTALESRYNLKSAAGIR